MYTLSEIINEVIAESGDSATNKFARMYAIGLSGLREIHQDVNGIVKIVELDINSNDTVDLPNDYIKYSKVGICGADGRVHSLGLDNSLCLNKIYNDCGVQIKHNEFQSVDSLSIGNGFFPFFGILGNPIMNGGLFWAGGGQNGLGYFRYDRSSNQLLLSNLHIGCRKILLEYVADVNSEDGDFVVHPFIIQTIKDWIFWKLIANDKNYGLGDKQYREKSYKNSYRQSNLRYNSATIQEWTEALRKSNSATTRF